MPKRLVPSCGRSPRPSRRSRLISPPSNPSSYTAPNSFVSTPVVATIDLLDNHIDASAYSYTQLQWLLSHHIQHYETRLDFSRCEDAVLISLFPSKYGECNRIPMPYRHTAAAIRQFQKFGNRQQTNLITQDDASPAPLLPELKNYPCLGLSVQYLVKNVVNETRKATVFDGYCHLIREAIRSRADNIRDQLYPEYFMIVQGIIVSNYNALFSMK